MRLVVVDGTPFISGALLAEQVKQRSFARLEPGRALPVCHRRHQVVARASRNDLVVVELPRVAFATGGADRRLMRPGDALFDLTSDVGNKRPA